MAADGPTVTEAPELNDDAGAVVTVRAPAETMTCQRLPYFVGVSRESAGSRGLAMNLVVIPPGAAAEPHVHRGYETAIYVLQGRVETRYGRKLRHSVVNEAGDFVYIPADVPHQPRNLSAEEPAMAIVARSDAGERETVVLYDPDADALIEAGQGAIRAARDRVDAPDSQHRHRQPRTGVAIQHLKAPGLPRRLRLLGGDGPRLDVMAPRAKLRA
jgi:uncharacterized RmlC-like cupin family protein